MRRKRKIRYTVHSEDGYWWAFRQRKWIHIDDPYNIGFISNHKLCRTFDQACKIARKVPSGTVIIRQHRIIKGELWFRDYVYDVHNNR